MKRNTALLAVLLVAWFGFQAASAVTCPMTYPSDWPALDGRAVITPACAGAAPGYECKPVCLDGYTSWPDPVLLCGADGTWTLVNGIGCNPVCPGSPPVTANVTWTNVYDAGNGVSPNPAVNCTNRVPEFGTTSVECIGSCTAGFGSPVVQCQANPVTSALEWVVIKACYSAICDGPPPPFKNGTLWPSSCTGAPVGSNCEGVCGAGKPNFWSSGNATDKLPTISCVADAGQATGGRWDSANIVGDCVPVCVKVPNIWIRNGTWPTWCEPVVDTNTGLFTQVGGLTGNQVCSGVCQPGFYGSPKWVCSANGVWKQDRTGDCFPGETGGCFGPLLAPVPQNAKAWDLKKCWDMRVGWNCTTECNGNWVDPITDPAAIGHGTVELPYLPYAKCVYNASDFYNGTYGPVFGTCEPVCRGPLPVLANGVWPDSCLPKNGGIGGVRVNNSRCVATCNNGFSGANGVTPFVTCSGGGWGPLISACQDNTAPPPNVCAGAVSTPVPSRAAPWPVTCVNTPALGICSTRCLDDPNNATTGSTWGTAQPTPPFVRCQASLAWEAKATPTACNRVCMGDPPALASGDWPYLCTRQPDGAGGVVSAGVCKGVCGKSSVGVPRVSCVAQPNGALAWSTVSGVCLSNLMYQGACEGRPTAAAANVNQWPCQDLWVGESCTAKCNSGANPLVTYASGSPTITAPTVSCLYDPTNLPYLGRWGTTATGRCIAVCRAGPPAATGVMWPVSCTPQVDGSGGISSAAGVCSGSCIAGFTQVGAAPPAIVCGSGTWSSLSNPCQSIGRRLRAEGL